MTYIDLINRVRSIHHGRGSSYNHDKLRSHGVEPGLYEMRGSNHKLYTIIVTAGRDRIDVLSKHRDETLDKWCKNSEIKLVKVI